jgi:hypothetical protein
MPGLFSFQYAIGVGREPTGPAKALLRAIRNDPENVLKALAAGG